MKKKSIIAIVAIALVGVVVAIIGLLLSEDGSFLEGLFSGGGDGGADLDLDLDLDADTDVSESVIRVADNATEIGMATAESHTRNRAADAVGFISAVDIATSDAMSQSGEKKKKNRLEQIKKFFTKELV